MNQIWRLRHFLAVAEIGTLQGAARLLNVSQPALTKSIRLLEEHIGSQLFDRTPRGVSLTDAGETFYRHARTIEIEWDSLLSDITAARDGAQGRLKIGVGPTFGEIFVPKVLAKTSKLYPNIEFSVETGVGTKLIPALKSGEISVYVGGLQDDPLGRDEALGELPFYVQSNELVAAASHPVFKSGPVNLANLKNWRWVMLSYDQLGIRAISRFFRAAGERPPTFSVLTGTPSIALHLVQNHEYITSLPAPFLHDKLGLGLRALPFPDYRWSIRTGLTFRQSVAGTAPFLSFSRGVRDEVESFGLLSSFDERPTGDWA